MAERDILKTTKAVENLGKILGIPKPVRIESFDNSNIMGTSPVSAMVVFIDGKPSKKDYRKYKIKTVVGADDYASMRPSPTIPSNLLENVFLPRSCLWNVIAKR